MSETAITKRVPTSMAKASRIAQVTGFTDQVIALVRQKQWPQVTT